MQPPFPTKKFFLVLLFLIIVAGGAYKLFGFLNSRTVQKASDEKKVALIQNEITRNTQSDTAELPSEQHIATSTLNAVAAVVYLNEQTKANGATMEEIASKVGTQIQEAKAKLDANTYAKTDLVVDGDNSAEALRKYGNDMAGIFIKYGKQTQSLSYLEITKKALEENNPKILKQLDPYITFEKNVIKDALALKVPSTLASAHLSIINASAEMLLLFQGFQGTFTDVPSAVASNSRLEKSAKRLIYSFKEAGDAFNANGVVFTPPEAGSIFTNAASLEN